MQPSPFFLQKAAEIKQKVIIFPRKMRTDNFLVLTYLDNPMGEAFPLFICFFLVLVIFRRNRGSNLLTLKKCYVRKTSNKISQQKNVTKGAIIILTTTNVLLMRLTTY